MRKGQKATPESIALANQARWKTFFKELDVEPWKEYLDTSLQHINSTKKKKIFTLGEYYELLKSGLSSKDIKKQGYDRHLIGFYNTLLRSKISISKQEFEQDYLAGMSLEEISTKYSIDREAVCYLRELFGIQRKGATYINRKKTENTAN